MQIVWPIIAFLLFGFSFLIFWRHREGLQKTRLLESEAVALRATHQKQLGELKAQQQALFDSMVEGVLFLDEEGRVLMANRAFGRLFQLSQPVTGKPLMQAVRLHELQALVTRLQTENEVWGHELALPGFGKGLLHVNASVIRSDAERMGSILVFHDLTRLRQLENTRQEFVANVSHELRTPLSIIKGYVETLIDRPEQTEIRVKFLRTIEKHVDRLTFLIEDLLTLSKIESGQVALHKTRVALAPLVNRVTEDLQQNLLDTGSRVLSEVSPDFTVQADPDRLQQVLSNLLSNAIKYGKSQGTIRVRARSDGAVAEIEVEDDGSGIPPEALDRVFERFYRADKSRGQGGTGLGLAIVKHIVQSHGGKAWVESQPRCGAIFHITLPE